MDLPTPKPLSGLDPIQQQVVAFFVDGVRVIGLPPSIGEIYGVLYITQNPLSLDDLVRLLAISKGSASQGLRTLKTLGAVREIRPDNGRKTYYEPAVELKKLVGGFIREQIRPHMDSGMSKIHSLSSSAENIEDHTSREFLVDRLDRLETWMKQGKTILPILQKLLGQ